MYRTIDARFWTDPKVRGLCPNAKLLFLYLVTNPHAHVSGIYYLPHITVHHESGIPVASLDTLYDTLSGSGLARIDRPNEVVWVVNMMGYQGRGEKNEISAANHMADLHNSPLIKDFCKKYPSVARRISHRVSDRVSKGDAVRATPEQEQEQEQEIEKENTAAADDAGEKSESRNLFPDAPKPKPIVTPNPAPPAVYPVFPTTGNPKTWTMDDSLIPTLVESYPGVDVLDQLRKAHAWTVTNATNRKTASGMPKFLNSWMGRAQNDGPRMGGGRQLSRPSPKDGTHEGIVAPTLVMRDGRLQYAE